MTSATKLLIAGAFSMLACGAAAGASDDFARVTGRVISPSGKPVIGAAVVVADRDGRQFVVHSDGGGRFSALGLAPGEVTVSLTSFNSNVPACLVRSGETGDVEVTAYRLVPSHAAAQDPSGNGYYPNVSPARPCTIVPPTTDRYRIE